MGEGLHPSISGWITQLFAGSSLLPPSSASLAFRMALHQAPGVARLWRLSRAMVFNPGHPHRRKPKRAKPSIGVKTPLFRVGFVFPDIYAGDKGNNTKIGAFNPQS